MNEKIDPSIKWTAFEYNYSPKSKEWYWFVASGSLLVIIASILMRNFLFSVFGIVAGLVIMISGTRKPKKISFSISADGVRAGPKFYPREELKSFWIEDNDQLILQLKSKLTSSIKVPLSGVSQDIVKNFLLSILKEEKYEETLTETIAEKLGF